MQSLHELERRAEVHRLEALKKIEALTESSLEEQESVTESPTTDDRATEPAIGNVAVSHQHS